MVEGRQTVKVSDPSAKEGCAACTAPIVVANVTTTTGSATVKVAPGVFPAGITKGMAVEGAGIPTGTSVSSVSGSTLTLSAEATASATGVTLTFSENKPAAFQGASADGSKVFFTTTQRLLNGDSTTNLYEYDFNKNLPAYMNGQRLVDLSPDPSGANVLGVVRLASDGSHVYFMARGALTAEANQYGQHAEAGKENLYGVDTETGEVKFIAAVTGLGHGEGHIFPLPFSPRAQTTPDGRDLVFSSTAQLAGSTSSGSQAVYRYDFPTGRLTWLSHDAPGFTAPSEGKNAFVAAIPAFILGAYSDIEDFNRAISGEANGAHDGEDIIFTTVERLAANDHSSGPQLYLWHCASPCPKPEEEGEVHMISDGRSSVEPNLHNEASGQDSTTAMSASGADIFFSTGTSLVGQDTDELLDYYDARVGGGYPAPVAQAACAGEACQPPPTPAGSFGSAASSLLSAGGNLGPPSGASLAFQMSKPKPLTRAQQLAKALKACRKKHNKAQRVACERQARKKYAGKVTAKKKARA